MEKTSIDPDLKVFAVVYSGGDSIDYLIAHTEQEAEQFADEGWEEITEACYVRCSGCGAFFAFDEDWEDENAPKLTNALLGAEGHECPGSSGQREHVLSTRSGTYLIQLRKSE